MFLAQKPTSRKNARQPCEKTHGLALEVQYNSQTINPVVRAINS